MASPSARKALTWAPRHAATLWDAKNIYIAENGTSASDQPAADGAIYDVDRVMYLHHSWPRLQRATSEGVPVRGYFLWSLLGTFEWADGYATRFKLVHVDYEISRKRTPKLSAAFYREGHRPERGGPVDGALVRLFGRLLHRVIGADCSRASSAAPACAPPASRRGAAAAR